MEGIKRQLTTYGQRGDASRPRELARIHCLAKELGLDRDTYEAVLHQIAGVASAASLTGADRARVIAQLSAKLPRKTAIGRAPNNIQGKPMLRKIAALLADGGYPWAYGETLARKLAGCDRLEFATDAGLRKIIAALVYDQKRRVARSIDG